MPRRRRSGQQPEEFTIRWHSVANMATPSADIMSSPDPLVDSPTVHSVVPSSIRSSRVTRSARSSRFRSTEKSSPRKQMFELEVGDGKAPQKLLVTVETEAGSTVKSARRKLFQSSSPMSVRRRGAVATTTTVPLRDSIEDEIANATTTPRRRGRPRKSNGTPMPGAGAKRKASTPVRRTPRQPRAIRTDDVDEAPSMDPVAQPTPTPKRRGRPPRNTTVEPSSELGPELLQTGTRTRSVRRRRQAFIPEELIELADQVTNNASIQDDINEAPPSDNEIDLIMAPDEVDLVMPPDERAASDDPGAEAATAASAGVDAETNDINAGADDDSDIWMATLSNDATPRAYAHETRGSSHPIMEHEARDSPPQEQEIQDDYGYLAPAGSDVSSVDEAVPRTNDTIAQGEDFSMIFTIPSLNASLHADSLPVAEEEEIGEETNLIINNTLESLRESIRQEFAQEAEAEADIEDVVVEVEAEAEVEAEVEVEAEAEPDFDMEASDAVQVPSAPVVVEPTAVSPEREATPIRSEGHLSPGRSSGRWSRSPRKLNDSPLRRQALKFTARQAEDHAMSQIREVEQTEEGTQETPNQTHAESPYREQSNLYDDSFSEIPQEILAAATPRRPTTQLTKANLEAEASMVLDETPAEEAEAQAEEEMEEEEEVLEVEVEDEVQMVTTDEADEPPVASNTSMVSRSDNTRLPTPDDTPPHNEAEQQEPDKSREMTESSPSASSPEIIDERSAPSEVLPPVAEQLPQLSVATAVPTVVTKMTPVNQMSSPVQEPQSIGIEPLSERHLRPALSPIVRAGRALQSVTSDPPSPDRAERQLGSPFRSSVSKESWSGSKESQNSRRLSASSPRQASLTHEQPTVTGRPSEDPFAASTRSSGQAGFMQALARSMASSVGREKSPFRASGGSSMRVSHHDDEMSWVADEGPLSPRLRGDNSLKDTVQSAAKSTATTPRHFAVGQIDGAADEPIEDNNDGDEQSEEEDELQPAADDETDIWEFEARRDLSASTRQQPFGYRVATSVQRRRGLPSPWKKVGSQPDQQAETGSPRKQSVPSQSNNAFEQEVNETAEYSMLAQQQPRDTAVAPESTGKAKPFDLLAFFSSPAAFPGILAKQILPSKASGLADSAAEHSEPAQAPSFMPTTSMFPQTTQQTQTATRARNNMFASSRSQPPVEDQPMEQDEDERSSPSTPEQRLPTVAQKKNFTPNPKQHDQSFFQPSTAGRSTVTTPPRMQLSHADIQRWQQETSNASEESPEFRRPLLRPLPPKNASPTKSSLRSPLKPHTPGRVVEFTSSVLSPVEQARARYERRHSNSTAASQPDSTAQPPVAAVSSAPGYEENHESDVSMTEASSAAKPTPSSQPLEEPLSQTVWTRQHWILLDSLLQLRRQGPFDFMFHRRSDKFLGKTVKSHGEAMRLERWHLDCVDAFKTEVGGWDEGLLAKRVFALLLGEERRRRGVAEKKRTVMFH